MARKKPVTLETMHFQTQSAALVFLKSMLNEYIPGEVVSYAHSIDLSAAFRRHPDYESKKGCGIDHFEVMPGDYGSQCFCVVRSDGTKEGFSYKRCITQKLD